MRYNLFLMRAKKRKSLLVIISLLLVAAALFLALAYFTGIGRDQTRLNNADSQPSTASQPTPESFDKNKHSLTEPGSIWVVVNKRYSLPIDYTPSDLTVPDVRLRLGADAEQMQIREVLEQDLQAMFTAAAEVGNEIVFGSGYRSADLQKQFYDGYVAQHGQAAADEFSARPGHSEHQTGLAVDIVSASGVCSLEVCWEDTPEGDWVAKNAHRYGFIIRYQQGREHITGYQYEPWHLRYVGQELAAELHRQNTTMEEFFELGPAPDYR